MARLQGLSDKPRGPEFAVRTEGHTPLSASDFWKEVESKYASEVLGVPVYGDEVIEIDDGLRSRFFHVTENKDVEVLTYFQHEKARENRYVERTTS